jgi:hypothetical protein
MGKTDFKTLCKKARQDIGAPLTLKISAFSDTYDSKKNYAGMMVYAVDGKFQWVNAAGDAKGYKGRSFYFGILDTSKYPGDALNRDVGLGRVHHHLILRLTGREFDQDTVCCGGFAIHGGELKFSSVWLNARDQTPKDAFGKSDGNKMLSALEQKLCEFGVEKWKASGPHKIHELSSTLAESLGVGTDVKTTTSTPTPTFSTSTDPTWEWQGSNGSWNAYDAVSNAVLEHKYQTSPYTPFTLRVNRSGTVFTYAINFTTMTQTYATTHVRKIRRVS